MAIGIHVKPKSLRKKNAPKLGFQKISCQALKSLEIPDQQFYIEVHVELISLGNLLRSNLCFISVLIMGWIVTIIYTQYSQALVDFMAKVPCIIAMITMLYVGILQRDKSIVCSRVKLLD